MDIFFLKLFDVMLNTVKSSYFNKNKHLVASLLSAVTTFTYFIIIVRLLKINSISSIALVSLASFLGTYIPPIVIKYFEKDKVYVYDITPDNDKTGRAFARKMRKLGLPVVTYKSFNKYDEPVICAKVFSKDKDHSRLIKENVPKEFKYHVVRTLN